MNIVDRAFKLWERNNQPRRARARTVACSNSVDCASMLRKRSKAQSIHPHGVDQGSIDRKCSIQR